MPDLTTAKPVSPEPGPQELHYGDKHCFIVRVLRHGDLVAGLNGKDQVVIQYIGGPDDGTQEVVLQSQLRSHPILETKIAKQLRMVAAPEVPKKVVEPGKPVA